MTNQKNVDKQAEFSRLLVPLKEEEIKDRQANKPEAIEAGYKIYMPESKYDFEDLLLPAGALSIFAAPTSHCKSTILKNILLNTASQYQDKKFHLFSYKEDVDDILFNLLNTYIAEKLSANNRMSIRNYYRDENDSHFTKPSISAFHTGREQFFRELMDTGRINIHYVDYSSETLIEAIKHLHKNSDIGGIFIDYIHLLRKAEGGFLKRNEELEQICFDLKDLAVDTGLPIILGAHFNREVTNHLHLHSTKIGESVAIAWLANVIIGIWNNKFPPLGNSRELNDIHRDSLDTSGTIYLKILKNRGGRIGVEGLLNYDGNTGKISEHDPFKIF
ncbi:MAG: hypothetical protein GH151_09380 [Bacteroidetes bacterium]|nr:hypothetical protein [Bacteroidota bacterium]